MTRYNLYTFLVCLSLAFLPGCKGDENYDPARFVGMDKVTRLELSPSSPVLARDGKSGVVFMVRAFYKAGDGEAAMLQDRLPLDQITVTSSDGKTFGLGEVYTTVSNADKITFTASYKGGVTSAPISVRLISAEPVRYEPLTVPVRFHVMYTAQEKPFADRYKDEDFAQMLARLNSVLDGTIETNVPRPYRVDAGITFKLESVRRSELTAAEAEDTNTYIAEHLSEDPESVLHIWVSNHEGWANGTIQPWATFGDPSDIPMSEDGWLQQITDLETDMVPYLEHTDYGISLTFNDIMPENAPSFALTVGRYYALLSDGVDFRDYADGEEIPDSDFMSDTYSYDLTYRSPINRARVSGTNQLVYYRSTNIMEGVAGQTITPEQAARLRQAMKDIPYRQQAYK